MGVIVQQIPTKGRETTDCTFVPVHIRGLLNEFLRRNNELNKLRQKEMSWLILVILVGCINLASIMNLTSVPLLLNLWLIIGFLFILRQYLIVKRASAHVYVNVHILYHHFLGKLDVGFCEHESTCQCVENFRKYVWRKYRVSLHRNTL
jgi:hypothetical protein